MAKKEKVKKSRLVVSTDVDQLAAAGLPDDFDGVIRMACHEPWRYPGRDDLPWALTVRVEIEPDEGEDVPLAEGQEYVVQNYREASNLDDFIPADEDGEGVDIDGWDPDEDDIEDVRGVNVLAVGKREELSNNSTWAFFLDRAKEAGIYKIREPGLRIDQFLVGLHCHFNRVDQPTRKGLTREDDGKDRKTLVITEIFGEENEKKTKKMKAKSKEVEEEVEEEEEEEEEEEKTTSKKKGSTDLVDKLKSAAEEVIAEAGTSLTISKVRVRTMKRMDPEEKNEALRLMSEDSFWDNGAWKYDKKSGTVTVEEEED